MSHSKEELCARALVLAGGNPITSFSDGSKEATVASTLYEGYARSALCKRDWTFAMTEELLGAALSEAPLHRWSYGYQLPTDPVPLRVWGVYSGDVSMPFDRRGSVIYTDIDSTSEPIVLYTWRVEEHEWPEDFAQALVLDLAIAFGVAFDRTDRLPLLERQSLRAWAEAKASVSTGRTNKVLTARTFATRR